MRECESASKGAASTCVLQPDVIVHCAAERRPDVVERHTEAAVNLNVHTTSTLAKEAGG